MAERKVTAIPATIAKYTAVPIGSKKKRRVAGYVKQKKISEENIYKFLLYFDKLYAKFTDLEKREFMNSFIESIEIYEKEQPDGRFLKKIRFRFPIFFGEKETSEICWDNLNTVETVVLLGNQKLQRT